MRRLVCLVADQSIRAVMETLLAERQKALRIGPVDFQVVVHPNRDPGCYHDGPAFLAGLLSAQTPGAVGLVVFDQAWQGNPHESAEETERVLRDRFQELDIGSSADTVVIDPELEAWVWSPSPVVAEVLGWKGRRPGLRDWLTARGLWHPGATKPADPKAAFRAALAACGIPPSSALFRRLAQRVSLERCEDPGFGRLRAVLQRWFPA